jgi:hypothetical protein
MKMRKSVAALLAAGSVLACSPAQAVEGETKTNRNECTIDRGSSKPLVHVRLDTAWGMYPAEKSVDPMYGRLTAYYRDADGIARRVGLAEASIAYKWGGDTIQGSTDVTPGKDGYQISSPRVKKFGVAGSPRYQARGRFANVTCTVTVTQPTF